MEILIYLKMLDITIFRNMFYIFVKLKIKNIFYRYNGNWKK